MKRGFTLVELLGTIIILGTIALIATPPIINLVKSSDKKIDRTNIEYIYTAAKDYIRDHDDIYQAGETVELSIDSLVSNGTLRRTYVKQQDIDTSKCVRVTVQSNYSLDYEPELYTCSG